MSGAKTAKTACSAAMRTTLMVRDFNHDGLQSWIRLPQPFFIPLRSPLFQAWRFEAKSFQCKTDAHGRDGRRLELNSERC
jgi:hypothetical protein